MRPIGFSTGSLARGDFEHALAMMRGKRLRAVELSALREKEVEPLLKALETLDLRPFEYVSFHAPSRLESISERGLTNLLRPIVQRAIPIVLHPDIMQEPSLWTEFGDLLLIENMDKRKPFGRTASELECIFFSLPAARLCLDLGHARQVDPTMSHAGSILRKFAGRLTQLHVSEVNSSSHHEPLNDAAITAFRAIAHLIPSEIPVIIESPVDESAMDNEAAAALAALHSSRPNLSELADAIP